MGPLAHSPGWGNHIVEADPGVSQPMDDELGAARHVIGGARALNMLGRMRRRL
jgi:hypothetical protein